MKELEQYFKALADRNRLRIKPAAAWRLCVCDIQFVLEASQPNVSRHLAYLKNSGLVLIGEMASGSSYDWPSRNRA